MAVSWSAYDPLERGTRNEDPLGFFAYAMRLAEEWLPGITTRTRRLRYYSMVCGGLLLADEALGEREEQAEHRDDARIRLFLRWERLWALWNVRGGAERELRGLIGRNKIEQLLAHSAPPRSLDFPFTQRQPELGGLGSYRTSLEGMGFLRPGVTELTPLGERLGTTFWDQAPPGLRAACVRAVSQGRVPSARCARNLARVTAAIGLDLSRNGQSDGQVRDVERHLLRSRLLTREPGLARRLEVLDYLRARRLTKVHDEQSLLGEIGQRAGRPTGGSELERRAAAIVALEEFRSATLVLFDRFRGWVADRGRALSPAELGRDRGTAALARRVERARNRLRRFADSAQFGDVFAGWELVERVPRRDGVGWLEALLRIHATEMARRRAPRWFHPARGGRWELDLSLAGLGTEDTIGPPYAYRTENLVRLSREAGARA